jgi:hypothetical protein
MMRTNGSIFGWIGSGVRTALGHKRLVAAFYLVPLVPALLWAWVAANHLHGALDARPFAQEFLGGNAFGALQDFLGSPGNHLGVLLGALPVLLLVSLGLHLALAAGTAGVLLGKAGETPFFTGVSRFTGRYFRSLLAFVSTLIPAIILVGIASRIGNKLAENSYDERLLYGAVVVGLVLFLGIFTLTDLAYDLSRLSAADHDGRRVFRGYFRALGAVLRRPLKLIPFYLCFLVLLLLVVWLVWKVRGGVLPTSGGTILVILLIQQLGMVLRAFWQVSFWGAEVALYRDLGSPNWCGPRTLKRAVSESYALPGEAVASDAALADTDAMPIVRPESITSVAPQAPAVTTPIAPLTDEEIAARDEDPERV